MENTDVAALSLADATEGAGFWALVWQADIIVQLVMLLLLFASLWTWAVVVDKGIRLRRLKTLSQTFERAFWSGAPLDDLYERLGKRPNHPMAMMFAAAIEEWREIPNSGEVTGRGRLLDRVSQVMDLTIDREIVRLERHLGSLATIGSTAPFIGLFGTVWGIMNSFQSIALTKNTTLAVVAPGIAEALLATAMGLLAAVPAVVAYNRLSGDLDRFSNRLGSFAEEFNLVLSRELDGPMAA